MEALGKEESLAKIQAAIVKLESESGSGKNYCFCLISDCTKGKRQILMCHINICCFIL